MKAQQPIGKDLYMRRPGDPNYQEGVFESNDSIENVIQQVRMTLLTRTGEVLGEDIGFDSEKYLFEFEGVNIGSLEDDANSQINEYVLLSRPYRISASGFTLMDEADPFRVGLGLDVKIDGKSAFAALFDL
jgi:hypothetical protein